MRINPERPRAVGIAFYRKHRAVGIRNSPESNNSGGFPNLIQEGVRSNGQSAKALFPSGSRSVFVRLWEELPYSLAVGNDDTWFAGSSFFYSEFARL